MSYIFVSIHLYSAASYITSQFLLVVGGILSLEVKYKFRKGDFNGSSLSSSLIHVFDIIPTRVRCKETHKCTQM